MCNKYDKLEDIKKYSWMVTPKTVILDSPSRFVPIYEQEVVVQIDRDSDTVNVSCSHQPFLTRLKKLEAFKVTRLTFSRDYSSILQVDGTLPPKCVSFRKLTKKRQSQEDEE